MPSECLITKSRLFLLLYLAAVFLGSGLLFSLEPMVGKQVLPRLGGAPAVWNTCLLFFQTMLLAGYAYAHYGVRWLGVRRHAVVHTILLIASFVVLPVDAGAADPPVIASPIAWLLGTLLLTIGLPFFVLSATAPLVQRWLAATQHAAARDPYFLYAASNLGSLAGLALYPFVLEPLLGLRAQAIGWMAAYLAFAVLIAWLALRAHDAGIEVTAAAVGKVTVTTGLKWAGIALIPSALLLTVTGYVTTDIAPMPLLWIVPLALYLGTFVLAFGIRTERPARVIRLLQATITLGIAAAVIIGVKELWLLPLHLVVLTLVSYIAHARLAAERPHTADLTAFYLWISLGGTLGGVFGAIIAPLLLTPELEYVLLLPLALLLPGTRTVSPPPPLARVLAGIAIVIPVGVAVALLGHHVWGAVIAGGGTIALLLRRVDHGRIAVAAAVAIVLSILGLAAREFVGSDTLVRERNFFGTLRVTRTDDAHRLMHGRIIHGAQLTAAAEQKTPVTYYSRAGPLGDVFEVVMADVKGAAIGSVGLGVGTVACYSRPGDTWDLFEINPAVVRIAKDARLFSYLDRCAPQARIIIGDGRRALQAMTKARYDLIVLDAFSSDAIPAHLLTREAFVLYMQRLTHDGVLAVHISNRFLDLEPVVAANARALGAYALLRDDPTSNPVRRTPSRWVVLAHDSARIGSLARLSAWTPATLDREFRPWTDDYTSLLPVLRMLQGRWPAPTAQETP